MPENPTYFAALALIGLAVLVGMSFLAYLLLTTVSQRHASLVLWAMFAVCFVSAPVAAVARGGWWWLTPWLAAACLGLFGSALRGRGDQAT